MKHPWCLLLVLGCGGSKPSTDHATPVVTTPIDAAPAIVVPDAAPAPALTLTIDGKAVPIVSVIAAPDGDDVKVQITTFPYSCEEWVAGFRDTTYENEVTIDLILAPNLAPDGSLGWAIRGTAFQNTTSSAQDGGDPVPGATLDPSAGAHSRLDVALDLETLGDVPQVAHLAGSIDALGCGPLSWMGSREAAPTPLPGVVMKVAGQEVPIGGAALLIGERGRQLVLATTPVKCVEGSSMVSDHRFLSASWADVELELTWYKDATDADRGVLGGELLGKGGETSTWDGGRLTATPSTARKGPKQVSVLVTLGGSAKLGDYPVELSGTVTAKICR